MNEFRETLDTPAWIFQCWASFLIASVGTIGGIFFMPVSEWIRGFLAMGMLFLVGSTFTLAKTLRDNHEAKKFLNRVRGAKTEKLIREFETPKEDA